MSERLDSHVSQCEGFLTTLHQHYGKEEENRTKRVVGRIEALDGDSVVVPIDCV